MRLDAIKQYERPVYQAFSGGGESGSGRGFLRCRGILKNDTESLEAYLSQVEYIRGFV